MKTKMHLLIIIILQLSILNISELKSQPTDSIAFNQNKINNKTRMLFPRPFAIAIDDLGWNIGNNDGYGLKNGPYRIGLNRAMGIDNYKVLVEIASQIPVRLQALFVLGEMDRENVLAKYPTTNPLGKDWDNSQNVSDEQLRIMEYVVQNAAYIEFGMHGVLHEYWEVPGKRSRAEWYNIDDNRPWPTNIILDHITCYKEIMGQYGINKENGHSFPESFVPCAYAFHWNPNGDVSTSSLLNKEGVKYINTLFQEVSELNPPTEPNGGGIDHGAITVNRINYGNDWFALSSLPTVPIEEQESDIIETHWSNWLAQDAFLQNETNKKWVNYYNMVQKQGDRYVARNTAQFYSQWFYKKYTTIEEQELGTVIINNTNMPQDIYDYQLLGNMILKIPLSKNKHISKAIIDGDNIAGYYEENGFGIIVLPILENKTYTFNYSIGNTYPNAFIWYDGTYNVYSFSTDGNITTVNIRFYGKQDMKIVGVSNPKNITIDNQYITLINKNYNIEKKTLILTLSAHDIQGESGEIRMW